MLAALYIRLSNEDQSNYSIESQQRAINDYCNRYHINIFKTYIDNGQSSYTFDRKQFNLLERELKKNNVNYIIVYHLDRFSRNMAEAMMKINTLLDKGIRVRDISEPIEMNDFDTNTFILRSMKFMGAEMELRRLKERITAGVRTANLSGYTTHKAPYGYINSKREDSKKSLIIIEESKAQVVRFIFKEFISDTNIAEIKRQAKTKFGYTQNGNSAIERILENPIYAGLMRVKDPATGQTIIGKHDPIINESTYYMVQAKLHALKAPAKHATDNMYLKGSIYCHCGRSMTVSNPKGKLGKEYWYYLCPVHKKNLNADKLHDQFTAILEAVEISKEDVAVIKSIAEKEVINYIENITARKSVLEKELASLSIKIENMERKFLETNISKNVFDKTVGEHRVKKINIENELSHAETIKTDNLEKVNIILSQLSTLRKWFDKSSIENKRKAIRLLFGGVLLYVDGVYRTPYLDGLIKPKALLLKEKGLLEVEKSLVQFPFVEETGTLSKTNDLYELFIAC
jgi:site-specific DNA recombinase